MKEKKDVFLDSLYKRLQGVFKQIGTFLVGIELNVSSRCQRGAAAL